MGPFEVGVVFGVEVGVVFGVEVGVEVVVAVVAHAPTAAQNRAGLTRMRASIHSRSGPRTNTEQRTGMGMRNDAGLVR
jgi:hypothetical protein